METVIEWYIVGAVVFALYDSSSVAHGVLIDERQLDFGSIGMVGRWILWPIMLVPFFLSMMFLLAFRRNPHIAGILETMRKEWKGEKA